MMRNLMVILVYRKISISIIAIFALACLAGCAVGRSGVTNEKHLQVRVKQYYDYLSNGNFERCWNLWSRKIIGNKTDFVEKATKSKILFISYSIESVNIEGYKAKVYMTVTIKEDKEVYPGLRHIDQWKFIDNDWYLIDFGKGEVGDDEVVKPIVIP